MMRTAQKGLRYTRVISYYACVTLCLPVALARQRALRPLSLQPISPSNQQDYHGPGSDQLSTRTRFPQR